jgi:hypothetical protein
VTSEALKDRSPLSTLVFVEAKEAESIVNANRWLGAAMIKIIELAAADGFLERPSIRRY